MNDLNSTFFVSKKKKVRCNIVVINRKEKARNVPSVPRSRTCDSSRRDRLRTWAYWSDGVHPDANKTNNRMQSNRRHDILFLKTTMPRAWYPSGHRGNVVTFHLSQQMQVEWYIGGFEPRCSCGGGVSLVENRDAYEKTVASNAAQAQQVLHLPS